jgi:Kae1-associated kinase Bud32
MNLHLPKGFSHPVKIGVGGFGAVYRARQNALGRLVVLKYIDEKDHNQRTALKKEAAMQADLQMYGIPQIFDVQEHSNRICIIMQWIKGCSLRTLLESNKLSIVSKNAIGLEIIKITASLHNRGYAHRDLKPENIIVSSDGVFLIDFGLARNVATDYRQTMADVVKGTPAYLAPELLQGKGNTADPIRADVFSLGKVIKEIFGTEPVQECITRCLENDPFNRPASASEIIAQWKPNFSPDSIIWSEIAEPYSNEILAKQLYTAACTLINTHRTVEAYQLLVECLQTDPESSDAFELMERFPIIRQKHSLKSKLNLTIAGLITILICFICVFFLIPNKPKNINTIISNIDYNNDRALFIVTPEKQSQPIDVNLPFKEEAMPINVINGHVIITSQLPTGDFLFNGVLTEINAEGFLLPAPSEEQNIMWKSTDGNIIWKETVLVLPFEEKRIHIKER